MYRGVPTKDSPAIIVESRRNFALYRGEGREGATVHVYVKTSPRGRYREIVDKGGACYSYHGSAVGGWRSDEEEIASAIQAAAIRPGDTDRDYFDSYSPESLDFAESHGEHTGCLTDEDSGRKGYRRLPDLGVAFSFLDW